MKDCMIPVRCTGTTKSQFSAICKAKETTPSEYLRELIKKKLINITELLAMHPNYDNLTGGIRLSFERKSVFRFLSKRKTRSLVFDYLNMSSASRLLRLFDKLYKDKPYLSSDWMNDPESMAGKDIKVCAHIAAIAYINEGILSFFLSPFLAFYLKRRLSPLKLAQMSFVIYDLMDFPSMINSIRYLGVPKSSQQLSKETHERNRSK